MMYFDWDEKRTNSNKALLSWNAWVWTDGFDATAISAEQARTFPLVQNVGTLMVRR